MDWSLILGITGIVVSVAVGWLTYYLADKRQRRNRYLSTKNAIVTTLSRSLGEETVPTPALIGAVIRSVLREENARDLEAITIDEVTDDLVRQVTSDPFLAADRRQQLQSALLAIVTKQPTSAPEEEDVAEREPAANFVRPFLSTSFASVILGTTAALFSLILFGDVLARSRAPAVAAPDSPSVSDWLIGVLSRTNSQGPGFLLQLLFVTIVMITLVHFWERFR